jgi:hypothetical protein
MPTSMHESALAHWATGCRGLAGESSQQPGWRLVAVHRDVRPAQVSLIGPSWTIGRSRESSIIVAREAVSRQHALIVREGEEFRLRDVGSRNGTYINGVRLDGPELLVHRDLIGLGEPEPSLRFVDDRASANPVPGTPAPRNHHSRLRFDDRRLRFFLYDQPLDLTENEFRLLRFLHASMGIVCPREDCAVAVWGADAPRHEPGLGDLVAGLRDKLRHLDPEINLVQTRITGGIILTI